MKKTILVTAMLVAIHLGSIAQTQVIAHRGVWKNTQAPQNSIAALNHAITDKLWGSEFDVHITKDDILVVNHDNDYYGIDIATATYQELLSKKHPNGESIPTEEEYLKAGLTQKKTKLIYELKSSKLGKERTLKAAELRVALVNKLKANKMVEYIAFSYDACLKIRELDKKAKVHYLNGDKTPQQVKADKLTGVDYNLAVFRKNPTWIQDFKKLKLKTNVWTVNKAEDMQYFLAEKIDFITTDEPEILVELMKK